MGQRLSGPRHYVDRPCRPGFRLIRTIITRRDEMDRLRHKIIALKGQGRLASLWLAVVLLITILLSASCRRQPERPRASYAPIPEIEQTFGRLFATSNLPTPDQNGTGDRLGLFRDDTGTLWGIPLTIDDNGNILGCAPPGLRDAPVTDRYPSDAGQIVGVENAPTGWRGGTGRLELIFRDSHGTLKWQPVTGGDLKSGPICWSQSPPVQPLKYYRMARTDAN